jgi:hypothetical protein
MTIKDDRLVMLICDILRGSFFSDFPDSVGVLYVVIEAGNVMHDPFFAVHLVALAN